MIHSLHDLPDKTPKELVEQMATLRTPMPWENART
jgi:hypothetical protein